MGSPKVTIPGPLTLLQVSTSALPDGKPWDVPPSFLRVQRGWAIYEQNELLSLALQALFAAVLRAIERDHSGRLQNAAAAGDICVSLLPSSGRFRKRRLADVVSELALALPDLSAWQNDAHEIQRGWKILETQSDETALEAMVEEGVEILLSHRMTSVVS